jgi:hypothetical protein
VTPATTGLYLVPALVRLGARGRKAALQTRQENAAKYQADVLPVIQEKQRQGAVTLRQIAEALNADGTPAPRGGEWSAVQVKRILDREPSHAA